MPGGLISALGLVRLKTYLESLGRYAAIQAALAAVLGALLVLTAGFGVTALTIWLAQQLGAAAAFAIVGAGFLMMALLLEVVIVTRKRKRPAGQLLFGDKEPSDQVALGSIAALAVIGYLLGRRGERR
jgi:hypothetical protein